MKKMLAFLASTILLCMMLIPCAVSVAAEPNVNKNELNRQIAIAEALIKTDYTYDSWAVLENALKDARDAQDATTQKEMDEAAKALKASIAELVKIDGSALRELLAMVREFLAEDDSASVWGDLLTAVEEAEAALVSGDQARIDAAYNAQKVAFDEFKEKIATLGEEKIVIQEVEVEKIVEVPVEVDEDSDYDSVEDSARDRIVVVLGVFCAVLLVTVAVLIIVLLMKKK